MDDQVDLCILRSLWQSWKHVAREVLVIMSSGHLFPMRQRRLTPSDGRDRGAEAGAHGKRFQLLA
jgi:hypothetical protein